MDSPTPKPAYQRFAELARKCVPVVMTLGAAVGAYNNFRAITPLWAWVATALVVALLIVDISGWARIPWVTADGSRVDVRHAGPVLRGALILLLAALWLPRLLQPGESAPSLTTMEAAAFRSAAFTAASAFRSNPLAAIDAQQPALERLVADIERDQRYSRELPRETAVVYRLRAVTALLSGPTTDLVAHVRVACAYIDDSAKVDPELWQDASSRKAVLFFRRFNDLNTPDPKLRDFLFSTFAVAMINADASEIEALSVPLTEHYLKTIAAGRGRGGGGVK